MVHLTLVRSAGISIFYKLSNATFNLEIRREFFKF